MDKEEREIVKSHTPLGMALDWAMTAQDTYDNRELFNDDDVWDRAMFHAASMSSMWGELALTCAAVEDDTTGRATIGELLKREHAAGASKNEDTPKTDNVALMWPSKSNTERLRCDRHGLLLVEHNEDTFHDGTWRLDSPRPKNKE